MSSLFSGSADHPAPAIPAATVILLRDEPDGLTTLMLRRNPVGAFGGMWVFPGGRVEPEDRVNEADTEAVMRRAAVREAVEESGLLLEPHELTPFSRWLPPAVTPRRFDTWFFVARAVDGDVVVDGQEIHEHLWLHPEEVIARRDRGELDLAPPTYVTLLDLARAASVDAAVEEARRRRPIPLFESRFTKFGDQQVLLWAGDAGYDTSDAYAEGPRHRLWMFPTGWVYERT